MGTGLVHSIETAISGRSPWKGDALWATCWCLGLYLFTLVLRLSLWTVWDHPMLQVNGEFLLSTHDSYLWLAKARDVTFAEPEHMAWLTKIIHELTGIGLGDIGFWGPAFFASLLAPVCFLWGWLAGGRTGGIVAGFIGAMSYGFFQRSKLGYYDTDLFTMLMPLLAALALAWWGRSFFRRSWLPVNAAPMRETISSPWTALAVGLLLRMASWWHQDLAFLNSLLVMVAGVMIILLAVPERRLRGMLEWTAILMAALPGMGLGMLKLLPLPAVMQLPAFSRSFISILLAAIIVWLIHADRIPALLKKHQRQWWLSTAIFLFVTLLLTNVLLYPATRLLEKVATYLGAVPSSGGASGQSAASFPSIISSVVEAAEVSFSQVLAKISLNSVWLGGLSLVCAVIIVAFRPETILLLPMLLIAVMGLQLGTRFAMFGGGASAIFLGLTANTAGNLLFGEHRLRQWGQPALQAVIGLALLAPAYMDYRAMPPTPVVTKPHAEALMGLRERIEPDSVIWTWWDWGYATWYYSGIRPPIDGGRHTGEDVFPMAHALATTSPQRANQMLFYATSKGFEPFKGMSADKAQAMVESLGESESSFGVTRPQYFVVSWKNFRLTRWISHFGNWNLKTGSTEEYDIVNSQPSQLRYNVQHGAIANPSGQRMRVESIDIIGANGVKNRYYPLNAQSSRLLRKTPHLVINGLMGKPFLLSPEAYDSMLVRLLRDDPESPMIRKHFRLVADGLPFVRIYELVNPEKQ